VIIFPGYKYQTKLWCVKKIFLALSYHHFSSNRCWLEKINYLGQISSITEWDCDRPMEEVYLIAGKYVITEEDLDGIKVMTYTYQADPQLTGSIGKRQSDISIGTVT